MDGVFLINKPKGITSFDVVRHVKKLMKTKRVGHCGTLDPLATGVLVVCVNRATKISQFLMSENKVYQATIQLGKRTDTLDEEGMILEEKDVPRINDNLINDVFRGLIGPMMQKPPMYSAVKVNGKKLYEYARNNQEVEVEAREITIHELNFIEYNVESQTITFNTKCSKGTYIRVLCEQIAENLGTIGYMKELVRIKSGDFSLEQCSNLENLGEEDLMSIEVALSNFSRIDYPNAEDIKNGKKIKNDVKGMQIVYNNDKALAVYQSDGNGYLKCVRGIW